MQPNGARKKRLAHAIFSKEGPNLNKPEVTNKPNVTPNTYRAINKNINGNPILKIETPKRGIVDGPGSYSYRNLNFSAVPLSSRIEGADLLNLNNAIGQGSQFDIRNMKDTIGINRNILDQIKDVKVGSDEDNILKTNEEIFTEQKAKEDADKAKAKEMGVTVEEMKAIQRENLRSGSVKDEVLEKNILTQPDLSKSTG